jgi:hypothetical protein
MGQTNLRLPKQIHNIIRRLSGFDSGTQCKQNEQLKKGWVCHTKPTINYNDSIASAQVEVKTPRPQDPSIPHISSFFSDDKMCFFI